MYLSIEFMVQDTSTYYIDTNQFKRTVCSILMNKFYLYKSQMRCVGETLCDKFHERKFDT